MEELFNYTLEELKKEMVAIKEPVYRAEQVFAAACNKNVRDFADITTIPKKLASELSKVFDICTIKCVEEKRSRKDRTEKFLWELKDGNHVETVLIPSSDRKTVCLSTQVGCKYKCPFCASGAKGFVRNLEAAEIVNQLLEVQKKKNIKVTNVVFMGMGEPLDNFANLEKAIRIFNDPKGTHLGARKMTVSTSGIIPGIKKLEKLGLQVELSISLHAADERLRNELVPANRKYPLGELLRTCKEYTKNTGRMITLEYTVIHGKNDSFRDAEKLADIVHMLGAKVNIIACNPNAASKFSTENAGAAKMFKSKLAEKRVTVTIRESKGDDIFAACGQLAAERKE